MLHGERTRLLSFRDGIVNRPISASNAGATIPQPPANIPVVDADSSPSCERDQVTCRNPSPG